MTLKQYKKSQAIIAACIAVLVSLAVTLNSVWLAVFAVMTGMIVTRIVYKKSKILADERIISISEKASRFAYSAGIAIVGITAFLLTMIGRSIGDTWILVGSILSYVTLLLMALYSIAFYYLNRKYGAGDDE